MTDPTIEAPVSSPNNDWWRRALRTLLQLIAGGGFTWLFDQLAVDLPAAYVPYVMGLSTVLVALAQNAAEDAGKLKPILKERPAPPGDVQGPPAPSVDWHDPATWPSTPIGGTRPVERRRDVPNV